MNKQIKSKSGIIIPCPPVITGYVKIFLRADIELDIYYTNSQNMDNLKLSGNFSDESGIVFSAKGKKNIDSVINTIPGDSYFIIINDTDKDGKFSFEIKQFTSTPTVNVATSSTASLSGFGTSGYKMPK